MANDQLNVNINVEGSEEVRQQLIKLVGELEAAGKGSSEQVKELYLKITELTKAQETLRNSNASALKGVRETVELWEQALRIISGANEQLENQSALLERINRNQRQLVATASASDQAPFADTSIQKIPQISEEPIRAIVKLNQALAETATYATFAADYIDGTFEVVDSQRNFAAATANVADTARRAAQSFNFLDDTLESLNVRTRTPYFLQFATFPAADIARRVGLNEVSDALFGLGSALGVLDQIGPTIDAVKGLTTDLLKMGGTIGTVANVVNQLIAQMGVTGVAGAFLTLTTLAAPVVAGFVALGAVLQSLEDRAKAAADQAERVSNQFAAEANVARQNLTTRQVQEEIAAAERALNIQRARQATLLSLESELSSVRDNMFNGAAGAMFVDALSDTARSKFNELADALGITVTRTTSLADVFSVLDLTLDASKTTITGLESEITGLQDAIANGTTATGDAAEAEQKLVTARNDLIEATQRAFEQARAEGLRAAQEAGGELANAFIQEAQIAAQGLTTEQVQAQIRDEERRSQALRRRLQQLNDFQNIDRDNPAAIQQLREFLGIAGTQINTWDALNAAIDTTNDALEQSTQSQMTLFNAIVIGATAAGDAAARAQELADAVGKGFVDAVNSVKKAIAEFQELQRTGSEIDQFRNQAYLDALEATVKAQEALAEAQKAAADAAAEYADKVKDIQADLAEKLTDADQKLSEDREKIAKDNAKAIAKIERDFQRSYAQAVGDRDAVAAAQAKQRRADALADLEESQKEQQQSAKESYDKAIAAAREAADKALAQERERYAKEAAIRAQAVQQANVALLNSTNAQTAIYRNLQNAIPGFVLATMNSMNTNVRTGFTLMYQASVKFVNDMIRLTSWNQYRAGERGSFQSAVNTAVDRRMTEILNVRGYR